MKSSAAKRRKRSDGRNDLAKKRKGLGNLGVDALLTGSKPPVGERLIDIGIERIRPGRYQPRIRMDDEKIEELATSIKSQGLIQPLVLRAVSDGGYELIAGERRWRAAQRAGLETVPAIIRKADERTAAALSLIENIQREDLNALEEANALQQLAVKFDLKHQEIADLIGRSRPGVTNLIRLLDLAPEARELLESGALEMGHGRALLRLPRPKQGPAGQEIAAKHLTVRETEDYVEALLGKGKKKKKRPPRPPEIPALERELAERLGTSVHIQHGKKGGKVTIRYTSLDVLDGVLRKIKG